MKKGVCVALATALLLLALPTLALGAFTPALMNAPKISSDLIAQQDTICIGAMVKIHPTLQLAIDKLVLYDDTLNPATKNSTELTFTVQVNSNLPFRKQITITPFTFVPAGTIKPDGTPVEPLMSYQYINDQWVLMPWDPAVDGPEPGTGDVIETDQQSVHIREVDARTGLEVSEEETVGPTGVYPGDGKAIGNIDSHRFWDEIRWHIGPIRWSNTAGYYAGQLCVTVYQN